MTLLFWCLQSSLWLGEHSLPHVPGIKEEKRIYSCFPFHGMSPWHNFLQLNPVSQIFHYFSKLQKKLWINILTWDNKDICSNDSWNHLHIISIMIASLYKSLPIPFTTPFSTEEVFPHAPMIVFSKKLILAYASQHG